MADLIYRNVTQGGALTLVRNVTSPYSVPNEAGDTIEGWLSRPGKSAAAGIVDTTPPTLSGVAVTPSNVSAVLNWSTSEAGGTGFWLVDTNPTRTAAQVLAGTGVASDAVTVAAAGAQPGITANGLTAATGYFFHIVHRDAAGNDSAVSSTSFTTAAGATPFFTPNGAYWVDLNGAVPGPITAMQHAVEFRVPTGVSASGFLFQQQAQGFDVQFIGGTGSVGLRLMKIEDSAGTEVLGDAPTFVTNIPRDQWLILVPTGDHVNQQFTWALTGFAGGALPFTTPGNGFASTTRLSYGATVTGGVPMASGIQIRSFEARRRPAGGAFELYKRIAGDAATVNGDPWITGVPRAT